MIVPDNPDREDDDYEQPPGKDAPDDKAGSQPPRQRFLPLLNVDLTGRECGPFGPWPA